MKRQVREKIGAFERAPPPLGPIPVPIPGFTDVPSAPTSGFTDNVVVETRFINVLDTEKVKPRRDNEVHYCSGLI